MKIQSNEFILKGNWIFDGHSVIEDSIAKRVNLLIQDYLIKIATSKSGWEILYQDPQDKRYWELTYPDSESHGGGAPSLINISEGEAKSKYSI